MHRLDGRRIPSTGAPSETGEASARACADAGAQVACVAPGLVRVGEDAEVALVSAAGAI